MACFLYLCKLEKCPTMKKLLIISLCMLTCITLPVAAEGVHYLTTAEFKEKVFDYTAGNTWHYKGTKPCLIDFYTTWCGPCKRLAPVMEELAQEYSGKIVIYKVDTEQERQLAQYFGIQSIPTLLFCPIGANPQVAQGALPKETLEQAIKQVLLNRQD